VPRAGHMLQLERSAEVNKLIVGFLKGLSNPGVG
jgi:hypothetical protein